MTTWLILAAGGIGFGCGVFFGAALVDLKPASDKPVCYELRPLKRAKNYELVQRLTVPCPPEYLR